VYAARKFVGLGDVRRLAMVAGESCGEGADGVCQVVEGLRGGRDADGGIDEVKALPALAVDVVDLGAELLGGLHPDRVVVVVHGVGTGAVDRDVDAVEADGTGSALRGHPR
jgi:hypothetical protein